MTTYKLTTTGKEAPKVAVYPSMKEAAHHGNDGIFITTEDSLLKSAMTSAALVEMYNLLVPDDRHISKFETRAVGARRLFAELQKLPVEKGSITSILEAPTPDNAENPAAAPKKRPTQSKAPAAPKKASDSHAGHAGKVSQHASHAGHAGKVSQHASRTIHPSDKVLKLGNPRKAGSLGFRSMAIVIAQPGLTYEDYIKAGGRANDLSWDIAHGNVIILNPTTKG